MLLVDIIFEFKEYQDEFLTNEHIKQFLLELIYDNKLRVREFVKKTITGFGTASEVHKSLLSYKHKQVIISNLNWIMIDEDFWKYLYIFFLDDSHFTLKDLLTNIPNIKGIFDKRINYDLSQLEKEISQKYQFRYKYQNYVPFMPSINDTNKDLVGHYLVEYYFYFARYTYNDDLKNFLISFGINSDSYIIYYMDGLAQDYHNDVKAIIESEEFERILKAFDDKQFNTKKDLKDVKENFKDLDERILDSIKDTGTFKYYASRFKFYNLCESLSYEFLKIHAIKQFDMDKFKIKNKNKKKEIYQDQVLNQIFKKKFIFRIIQLIEKQFNDEPSTEDELNQPLEKIEYHVEEEMGKHEDEGESEEDEVEREEDEGEREEDEGEGEDDEGEGEDDEGEGEDDEGESDTSDEGYSTDIKEEEESDSQNLNPNAKFHNFFSIEEV